MEIRNLTKTVNLNQNSVKLEVEIYITPDDMAHFDYEGLDGIPDEDIPNILVAVGRMYSRAIKKGKIIKEKVSSII